MKVTAGARTVAAGGTTTLNAVGADQYGNAVPVSATWTVQPATLGTVQPRTGASVTFTAGPKGGKGTVTAAAVGLTATARSPSRPARCRSPASATASAPARRSSSRSRSSTLRGRPVPNAFVSVLVRRRGYPFFSGPRHDPRERPARPSASVTCRAATGRPSCGATANGYRWDRATPVNRFCK